MMLLKYVDSSHFVFDKNYVRPKIQKKVVENVYQVRDDYAFFQNLPDAPMVKRAKVPGITKEMKFELRKQ